MPRASFGSFSYRSLLGVAALLGLTGLSAAVPSAAFALPVLQVYVEDGTYDMSTETWTLNTPGNGSGGTVRVWVIGNTAGVGSAGAISNVNMVISYAQQDTSPTVSMTGSTTGGFGGVTDPSTAANGTHVQTVSGTPPTFVNGSPTPPHVFGTGVEWQQFALGDLTLTDSSIGDFFPTFPTSLAANAGQINVYDISFSGYNGPFHFDVIGTTNGGVKQWAAPNAHDAEVTFSVPEISTGSDANSALTLLLGALAVFLTPRRRR